MSIQVKNCKHVEIANLDPTKKIVPVHKASLKREGMVSYTKLNKVGDKGVATMSIYLENGVRLIAPANCGAKRGMVAIYFRAIEEGEAVIDGTNEKMCFHYEAPKQAQFEAVESLTFASELALAQKEYGVSFLLAPPQKAAAEV